MQKVVLENLNTKFTILQLFDENEQKSCNLKGLNCLLIRFWAYVFGQGAFKSLELEQSQSFIIFEDVLQTILILPCQNKFRHYWIINQILINTVSINKQMGLFCGQI